MEKSLTVRDFKNIVNKSLKESIPTITTNAKKESEKINKDYYNDIEKKIREIEKINADVNDNNVVKDNIDNENLDDNKTMLDLQFDYDPGDKYKENVKKQVTGEDSNFGNRKPDGENDEIDANKSFYDIAKKTHIKKSENDEMLKRSGLAARTMDPSLYNKDSVFESKVNDRKKMKILNFKKTLFKDEDHIMRLIPEEYKKDGNCFIMKDKSETEYVVEWAKNDDLKVSKGFICEIRNKKEDESKINRIKELFHYQVGEYNSTLNGQQRIEENKMVGELLDKIYELTDEK